MIIRYTAYRSHILSTGIGVVARGFEEETAVGSEMTSICLSSSSSLEQQQPMDGARKTPKKKFQVSDSMERASFQTRDCRGPTR